MTPSSPWWTSVMTSSPVPARRHEGRTRRILPRRGGATYSRPMDLAPLREEYARGGLEESPLAGDPFTMFGRWMQEAVDAGVHEPNAMVVATADAAGVP